MLPAAPRRRRFPLWTWWILGVVATYLIVAYAILPQLGGWEVHRHPNLADESRMTHTASGIRGDPLNFAIVGGEEEIIRTFAAAGWHPADALTFQSSVRIAVDTVFKRPDENAPVSNLFLYGRKEDLAFEKPVGDSPRERHHVRLWRSPKLNGNRALWMGAATHDVGVELSRTTAEVTHRISPDVDAERQLLLSALVQGAPGCEVRWVEAFHKELQGRNGGGDPWHTDGRLPVLTLPVGKP